MYSSGMVLWTDLRKDLYMRRVLKMNLLLTEFDCPEVSLCGC